MSSGRESHKKIPCSSPSLPPFVLFYWYLFFSILIADVCVEPSFNTTYYCHATPYNYFWKTNLLIFMFPIKQVPTDNVFELCGGGKVTHVLSSIRSFIHSFILFLVDVTLQAAMRWVSKLWKIMLTSIECEEEEWMNRHSFSCTSLETVDNFIDPLPSMCHKKGGVRDWTRAETGRDGTADDWLGQPERDPPS